MLFSQYLFKDKLFKSFNYESTWVNSYVFNFLAGATVALTTNINYTEPEGTSVELYAGETLDTLIRIMPNEKTSLLFISPVSGSTNIYIKIIMNSSQTGLTPTVSSLGLKIEQFTSLYTIATQILSDGLLQSNSKWLIDTELQKYPIPYAWFAPVRHREAIGKVAEAAGGVAFQDRHGVVRVQAGNYIKRKSGLANLFDIEDDRIIDARSPVSEIKNRIQITTKPYKASVSTITVWELNGNTKIENGEKKTFDVRFSDYEVVIDSFAEITGSAVITSSVFYSWGATIIITGTANGSFTLLVKGKPLTIQGSQLIEKIDTESIRINGDKVLSIDDNNLIQNRDLAVTIASDIIEITSNNQRDIELSWRGDPTIELGDLGLINGQKGTIISQEFNFNGALSAKAQIRRTK